jgi:transcriptional regulator with XRE-family HTH domain
MTAAIPVRRRLVGQALRRYRQALGYSLDVAAGILDCHRSKVSRVETGQRGITPGELRMLLVEYGIPKQVQDTLVALSKPTSGYGWWRSYSDVLSAEQVDYAIMEAAASKIMVYEPQWVPALLQTPAYAEAIAAADPLTDPDRRERLVKATLARQRAILRGSGREVSFILGEGALRQVVGEASVMREQAEALATGVPFQILPFAVGAPAILQTGPMTILEFRGAPELGSVRLGAVWAHEAEPYRGAFARLSEAALAPETSRRFVATICLPD